MLLSWKEFTLGREEISNKLDKEGLTFFFKKDGKYYGAPEESRIFFAKIRTNDTEDITADFKEMKFMAKKLTKPLDEKDLEEELFSNKDIPKIKVCDREEILKYLYKK